MFIPFFCFLACKSAPLIHTKVCEIIIFIQFPQLLFNLFLQNSCFLTFLTQFSSEKEHAVRKRRILLLPHRFFFLRHADIRRNDLSLPAASVS